MKGGNGGRSVFNPELADKSAAPFKGEDLAVAIRDELPRNLLVVPGTHRRRRGMGGCYEAGWDALECWYPLGRKNRTPTIRPPMPTIRVVVLNVEIA